MREPGFYWLLQRHDLGETPKWTVGEWRDGSWFHCGWDLAEADSYYLAIGPQIHPPGTVLDIATNKRVPTR